MVCHGNGAPPCFIGIESSYPEFKSWWQSANTGHAKIPLLNVFVAVDADAVRCALRWVASIIIRSGSSRNLVPAPSPARSTPQALLRPASACAERLMASLTFDDPAQPSPPIGGC